MMTKIKVDREALDRWREALKSDNPHIQQLAANALRATAVPIEQELQQAYDALLLSSKPSGLSADQVRIKND